MDELISAVIEELNNEKYDNPFCGEYEVGYNDGIDCAVSKISTLPSVQPEDWMERNKERILQAGMEGREIEFRIGGRLFAIREKAQ